MSILTEWQDFYVIVGSSAGALVGLQFVVITLVANTPRLHEEAQAGGAFATPTVVHFGGVLLLSALMCAPWHAVAPLGVLWGVAGFLGVLYTLSIAHSMRKQTVYRPEVEDWVFHTILPFVAYALLIFSAAAIFSRWARPLYGVAAATWLLLFIGIHNAWDAVTYHVFMSGSDASES
jgi:hypothetical protein